MDREELCAPFGGALEGRQGRRARDVPDEAQRRNRGAELLAGGSDRTIGDAEQGDLGALAGGERLLAAGQLDLEPGVARGARDRTPGASGAYHREPRERGEAALARA